MPEANDRSSDSHSTRATVLGTLSPRTRAIALVAIIAEALFLFGSLSLPEDQRIYAFGICAMLLVLAIASCVWLEGKEAAAPVVSNQAPVLPPQMREQVLVVDSATSTATGQAADTYRSGLNLKFAGRFNDAIKYFEKTLQFSPDHVKARYNIGSCLLYLNRLDESDATFRTLSDFMRRDLEKLDAIRIEILHGCYIQLNKIASKRGKYAEGADFLVESFRVKPDDPLTFLNLAIAALKTGNIDEARKWHQLLFGHPEHSGVLTTMGEEDRALIERLSTRQGVLAP